MQIQFCVTHNQSAVATGNWLHMSLHRLFVQSLLWKTSFKRIFSQDFLDLRVPVALSLAVNPVFVLVLSARSPVETGWRDGWSPAAPEISVMETNPKLFGRAGWVPAMVSTSKKQA